MTARVVPVSLLSTYIRQLFENDPLLSDVWVEGEVSEVFVSRAGHVYFTLRDAESQIKSVLFRGMAQRQRVLPAVGDQIAAHGRVTTYERDGVYQLYVDVIQHSGQGLLALQFEQLRQKLEAEGLFDESRKRSLPPLPRFIGVVTSAEGSVWHDIQTVLRRRYPIAHLILSPAPVQGESAPAGIVSALERLQRDGRAELAIVARGGGSAEDLAAFNDERVARAVFACRIPVVSAVGHETDWTIIDLVADLRAPTPSAAAELVAPSVEALLDEMRAIEHRASIALVSLLRDLRSELLARERTFDRFSPVESLRRGRDDVSRLRAELTSIGRAIQAPPRRDLLRERERLGMIIGTMRLATRADLRRTCDVLGALDPLDVLRRGYAVMEHSDSGEVIASVGDVAIGARVLARVTDGTIGARVDRMDANHGVRHNA